MATKDISSREQEPHKEDEKLEHLPGDIQERKTTPASESGHGDGSAEGEHQLQMQHIDSGDSDVGQSEPATPANVSGSNLTMEASRISGTGGSSGNMDPAGEEDDEEDEDGDSEESEDGDDDDDEDEEEEEQEEHHSNASSEDDSTSDEDEDEETEDEEPKLKYQRLAATLSETLKKDAVSAMAVSDRFLALGTHWGVVHILDLIGTDVKRFQSHSATVNELSIDTSGEFVASASDDGKVVINSLYTTEVQTFNYKRPVKAVCLEPDYSRKTTRQFVSGGMAEYLLLSGKGWFGNKDVVIHSGEGPIYNVKWRGSYIAWANEAGIKIYDCLSQQRFAYIDRPPGSPRADLFRCNLCWKSDTELFIGWANSVKIGVIKERSKMDVASGLPSRYVEIVCQITTDFIVSGIAPLDDLIVILSYMTDLSEIRNVDVIQEGPRKRQKARPPEIHILDIHGEAVANDVLSLFGFEHYQANDYRLEYLPAENPAENSFYIVSPKDIVVAKPRDLDDHIEWLVERKKYAEALRAAEQAGPSYAGRLQVNSIIDIGQKYLGTLMDEGRFDDAGKTCRKILRTDAQLWENWIYRFAEAKQIAAIRPYIPVENPKLSTTVYELILVHYLNVDQEILLEIIKTWPPSVYNLQNVVEAAETALQKDSGNRLLMESAAELYTYMKRFDMALYYGLLLRQPNILSLVKQYNLYSFITDHVLLLMEYDQHHIDTDPNIAEEISRAVANPDERSELGHIEGSVALGRIRAAVREAGVQTLAQCTDRVPRLVEQLNGYPKFLHIFLDAIFKKEPHEASEYHPLQVELYAEYDYPRLLEFLRSSTYYSVEKAYAICEARDLVPEMVFLLGKMGDNRKALMLIIERLGDVKRAIEFAKDQNDEELWEDLLRYSMDKPPFIVGLLENLGSHINPIRLVQRIPDGLEIPGLRNALVKIMSDYGIQMSLREGCEKILVSDTVELLSSLYKAQKRGLSFSDESDQVVIFFCRHAYHVDCLSAAVDAKTKGTVAASASPAGAHMAEAMSAAVERGVKLVYARPRDGQNGDRVTKDVASLDVPSTPPSAEKVPSKPGRKGLICPMCRNTAKSQKGGGERKNRDFVARRAGTAIF
ncbi:Vacuolar protein sorting-associated protein 41 [Borealophlyctis nickersoniae]|nr:Vacuolar protein sorting-associated protein 41 [Borealophlyctis nickersoniae]